MRFELTTLRDLVGCSTIAPLGTLVSKGQIVGIDLEPHRAATQPRAGSYELTNSIALSFVVFTFEHLS